MWCVTEKQEQAAQLAEQSVYQEVISDKQLF